MSRLFFANDNLLFCKSTTREYKNLLDILALYEGASGQAINRQKTTLFFSPNTNQGVKLAIQNMLGAQIMANYERYLGLPMIGGKSKVSTSKKGNKKGDGMEREAYLKGQKRGVDQNCNTSNSNLLNEHVQVPQKKL